MPSKILIDLEDALAWARGERQLRVRLPDGSISEMSLIEYRRICAIQKRLRAYRGWYALLPAEHEAPASVLRPAAAYCASAARP
jgi:hypothetical protein